MCKKSFQVETCIMFGRKPTDMLEQKELSVMDETISILRCC